MKFSLLSDVLFLTGWMSFVAAGEGPEPCCLKVTETRIPVENIVKYEIQEPTSICSLRAVRFYTKRSKVICSSPDSKYAKRVMDIVDGRLIAKPIMCFTSSTNTIPAVTTTNEIQQTQTETSKSTTASRIVKRSITSRPETETSTRWMSVVETGDLPGSCCLTVTGTRIPVENIVKYDMQDPTSICSLRAVRFYTKRSKVICSDPDSKYAKRVMDLVDGRTIAKPTMSYTSTTNTIPAVTTTNETPGKKTETSMRNGGPESCCNNVTTTTIPVKSILKKHLKSRSKNKLHRFQAGVREISSVAVV